MNRLTGSVTLLLAAALAGTAAEAHDSRHHLELAQGSELKHFGDLPHGAPATPKGEVPIWPGLGDLSYRITTGDPKVQQYFDQGLKLAFGFNHAEARRSFRAGQALDPACAMCFWGEALVLGPNINAPMSEAAKAPALAALAEAVRLAPKASAPEQGLIAALRERYSADPKAERAALDAAYAAAMDRLADRFPDDHTIAVLFAESLMDLTPWDYWADGGKTPKGRTADIVATLERVLAADPDHIGAIHFYIHTVEASDRPERAEVHADRLARMNIRTGHLAHMPSHIYYRIGRYKDSLATNRRAVAVDEAFLKKVKDTGIYGGGYYPHNIHFLMVSAQMAGDGPTVIRAAEKLRSRLPDDIVRAYPWIQPIKAAPYFAHAQFSSPETILAQSDPGEEFAYVKAMYHYARGIAFAAKKDVDKARDEIAAIEAFTEKDFTGLIAGGVPAMNLLQVARQVVTSRVALAEGDLDTAIRELSAAAKVEESLAYMEPPYWYAPVRQALGAALLLAGRAEEAETAFRTSLDKTPNNGWALFGLAEALKKQGKAKEAAEASAKLHKAWIGNPALLDLKRL